MNCEIVFLRIEGMAKYPDMKKRDGIRYPSKKPVKAPTTILGSSATGHQLEYKYAILACCNTTPKTKR
jgi:hypothetical protein